MLKRLATLFLLLSGFTALPGATYYISPTGNDNNSGTLAQPWATYPKAVQSLIAGDMLLVQPGIYSMQGNTNMGNNSLQFYRGGAAGSPITLQANGGVTNHFAFDVRFNYLVFDGFTWDGDSAGGVSITRGSGNVIITNCTFQNGQGIGVDMQNPLSSDPRPETSPGTNAIINCRFLQLINGGAITLFGVNNLVQGCIFANGRSEDSIYPMGSNSVIRQCTFTNMVIADGFANHPDILQAFGDNGFWSVGNLFEQNYVVNCPIQLMDFSMKSTPSLIVPTNNWQWGMVVRNNVFEDSNMQCSIDLPNIRFYNNTFRRCSNGGALLVYAFYDPTWSAYRGWGTGGAVVNNAFIDCSGSYAAVSAGPSQGDMTNGVGTVKGHASILLDGGVFYVCGTYTSLAGTITSGTLYCAAGDLYTVDATNFVNGAFSVAIQHTDPAGGVNYDTQQGYYLSGSMQFRLNTTSVRSGEVSALMCTYVANTSDFYAASDFNYKGSPGEVHGLQSGNPNLVAAEGWPATLAAPMSGSVLIDAGRNLSSLGVTDDFLGTPRPQGSAFDIGAFEYSGSAPPPVPPTITLQPQSATTSAGASVTFSVGATGTAPISYQWRFNGTSIPGATGSTLLKTSVQLADTGAYSVLVANSGGSTTSTTANLIVLNSTPVPPSIILPPQNVTTNAGADVSFSVIATGTEPLTYQWRCNGTNIAGATTTTYTRLNVQTTDARHYSLVVSNSAGTVPSAIATLTVTPSASADPSLVLHFDFDEDFSGGRVLDVSGNGNDGWQFNPTNWITSTSGVFGSSAANFAYVGRFTNNPPNALYSQYIAVTNCAGFSYLTNGTLSVWAKVDANGDLAMELMDTGSIGVSNTWTFGRDSTFDFTFTTYSGGSSREVLLFPVDLVRYGGSNPDLSTTQFHLYSVTIDCPGNQAIAYYDGQPYMTNTIGLPWLRVNSWLCVGAMQHGGTPQWGDDLYPNAGFFVGKMDDVRLYNRTLSATEIQGLYTGTQLLAGPAVPSGLRVIGAGP